MRNGGKPLVLKNPPDTARIKHLLEIFPEARFIHIYRNPYDLYYSMEHLWSKVILKHFALQKISEEEKIENIYTIYLMLMDQFEQDRGLIPADHLVEVRYEDLERDPLGEIIKIWDALGIPADELMVERLQQRIVREKKYKKFNHQFDEETLDEIYQRWGYYIDLWHYERPTICQTQVKIPAEHELSR
jgi:hypothetical protein